MSENPSVVIHKTESIKPAKMILNVEIEAMKVISVRVNEEKGVREFLVLLPMYNYDWVEEKALSHCRHLIDEFEDRNQEYKKVDYSEEVKFVEVTEIPDFNLKLHNYQIYGVNWLLRSSFERRSVILADEDRLGKKVQTIGFLKILCNKRRVPILLIVKDSAIEKWSKDLTTYCPSINFLLFSGAKDYRELLTKHYFFEGDSTPKFDVILTTSTIAQIESEIFLSYSWTEIIVDGVDETKNIHSNFYKFLISLRSRHRVFIGGNATNLSEIYCLFHFLEPVKFFSLAQIEKTQNLKELIKPYYLCRFYQDVSHELPLICYRNIGVYLSQSQQAKLLELIDNNKEELLSGSKKKLLKVVKDYNEIINSPLDESYLQGYEFDVNHYVSSSGKLQMLDTLINEILSENRGKILIVSQSEILKKSFFHYLQFKNDSVKKITITQRNQNLQDFTNESNIVLINFLELLGYDEYSLTRQTLSIANQLGTQYVFFLDSFFPIQMENKFSGHTGLDTIFFFKIITRFSADELFYKIKDLMICHNEIKEKERLTHTPYEWINEVIMFGLSVMHSLNPINKEHSFQQELRKQLFDEEVLSTNKEKKYFYSVELQTEESKKLNMLFPIGKEFWFRYFNVEQSLTGGKKRKMPFEQHEVKKKRRIDTIMGFTSEQRYAFQKMIRIFGLGNGDWKHLLVKPRPSMEDKSEEEIAAYGNKFLRYLMQKSNDEYPEFEADGIDKENILICIGTLYLFHTKAHEILSGHFFIDGETNTVSYTAWGKEQQKNLILGIASHGWGKWTEIFRDQGLELQEKILAELDIEPNADLIQQQQRKLVDPRISRFIKKEAIFIANALQYESQLRDARKKYFR